MGPLPTISLRCLFALPHSCGSRQAHAGCKWTFLYPMLSLDPQLPCRGNVQSDSTKPRLWSELQPRQQEAATFLGYSVEVKFAHNVRVVSTAPSPNPSLCSADLGKM